MNDDSLEEVKRFLEKADGYVSNAIAATEHQMIRRELNSVSNKLGSLLDIVDKVIKMK